MNSIKTPETCTAPPRTAPVRPSPRALSIWECSWAKAPVDRAVRPDSDDCDTEVLKSLPRSLLSRYCAASRRINREFSSILRFLGDRLTMRIANPEYIMLCSEGPLSCAIPSITGLSVLNLQNLQPSPCQVYSFQLQIDGSRNQ